MPTPLIRSFHLLGLHGYKDMSVDFNDKARIVIAENGSGKTTFLTAMYQFLKGDFYSLRNIHFSRIQCHFDSQSEPLILERDWISSSVPILEDTLEERDEYALLGESGLTIRQLADAVSIIEEHEITPQILERPPFRLLYRLNHLDEEDTLSYLRRLHAEQAKALDPNLRRLREILHSILGETRIVHLPTYRRIEASIKQSPPAQRRFPPSRRQAPVADIDEIPSQMQYGLTDIEARLQDLFGDIQRRSNFEYRRISANMIDALLARAGQPSSSASRRLPDLHDLKIFFSRLAIPMLSAHSLDRITELYESGRINDQPNEFLAFFLENLSTVIDGTKEQERNVEDFVRRVNVYMRETSESKSFEYDPSSMKIVVRNQFTGSEVKMSELSSGEKQVVSMLAFMYIYPRRKILLIDEPELSLSLDWQRRLIPDLLAAPNCGQLLAITHSPFIFDNELDALAGPLDIRRNRGANA